ncbi:death ligand signal enhancer isoform X1 [Cynoglossus semilaevis]|uniref:death ligand signal enhancer isoform X1 n=1 Tax=Cynoglossus semilaevis TaxID=244447 RepID=UPI000494F32C|nr:death ligand signal enhancer isoform X1 [Cynoglossus semilaevis]
MWRIQGFVGRVLHRCYGSSPLRLPQNHHVEDEVFNTSAVLSTSRHSPDSSSQNHQDGERRRKQRTFQFNYTELPRYTVLDAVGLGTAAVLFMQVCRRIHSQFSAATDPGQTTGGLTSHSTVKKCGYRILLEILSKNDVLPQGRSVLCLVAVPERQNEDQIEAQQSNNNNSSSSSSFHQSSSSERQSTHSSICGQQRSLLHHDSALSDLEEPVLSGSQPLQNDGSTKDTNHKPDRLSNEERLTEATINLKDVGDNSISVVLNIIGLESAKCENYEEAFACFLAAAQQGYNKAQFNVGVCYEKGRGVKKDQEKALYYYKQAAGSGHTQAQYRYAKLLLSSRRHQSLEELNTAIELLEEASAAGLTKAQLCLASVYCKKTVRNVSKSIQYLKMAAEADDGTALLFLGQCHESGFGVEENLRTALDFYKQAAEAGNNQAKMLLKPPNTTEINVAAMLRSISSAPCFPVAKHQLQPLSSLASQVSSSASHPTALPLLPHSWSTGSLFAAPASSSSRHLLPLSIEKRTCQWTVGVS